MASVTGAHHVASGPRDVHTLIARAINQKAIAAKLAAHDTVASLGQHPHDTVAGHAAHHADTVTTLGHGTTAFAGSKHVSVEKVVATQTVHKDGVTVHFADGSALHVAGVTHLHTTFFHH